MKQIMKVITIIHKHRMRKCVNYVNYIKNYVKRLSPKRVTFAG
ncbi:hypothetical protein SAMN05216323_10695 [Williamwhitmania taraxaci]|uniref:Transposase n=1 Tax=Williamwhitmania taraxaci TaxID=1640674 RepID=A0A1G6R2U9_9BACT|nr:hypothetical protein SAMN05216323_10695 [Williamwhitmania taraxaci]